MPHSVVVAKHSDYSDTNTCYSTLMFSFILTYVKRNLKENKVSIGITETLFNARKSTLFSIAPIYVLQHKQNSL